MIKKRIKYKKEAEPQIYLKVRLKFRGSSGCKWITEIYQERYPEFRIGEIFRKLGVAENI